MASKQKKQQPKTSSSEITKLFATALGHHQSGRLAEANAIYERILSIDPKHSDSLHLAGMVAYAAGDLPKALDLIGTAVKLQPRADIYLGNYGNVLRASGRLDEAIAVYQKAIAANPKNPTPFSNLGNAYSDLGRLDEAIEQYQKALALKPDFYETLFNLALTLRSVCRFDEAIACLRKATTLFPHLAEAHYTLGQTLLLHGDLADGWREYDWRWKLDEYKWLKDIHGEFVQPRWEGESVVGKTILVYAEQGMGDALQFCRYLPKLVAQRAQVVFAVHPRLMRVIGPMDGVRLVPLDGVPLPAFDFHSPLLSLPRVMGTLRVDDIPGNTPYLKAESERIAHWREKLAAIPGFKIGIAWQGNPNAKIDKGRSPPLAAFAPLALIPGVTLVSLQQRDGLDQLDRLPAGMCVEQLGGGIDDVGAFVDTAAIMENLDLMIVSDSAIAHLAGALGRPVWIPLKKVPDWRFLLEREDCRWYPNMRLFRQKSDGDWNGVFVRMADDLKKLPSAVSPAPTFAVPPHAKSTDMPMVPQSWGEIIDKITILEIKSEKLTETGSLANVRRELLELVTVREQHFPAHAGLTELSAKLKKVNESLWWIEDDIRDCERAKDFGPKFIELARAVYVTNDQRGAVKREINCLLGSALIEEKSYAAYTDDLQQASATLLAKLKGATQTEAMQPQENPVQIDECHGELVAALIKASKPKKLLELGFGSGYTTKRIIDAIEWNESGALDSVYGEPANFTMVDNWLDWGGQIPEAVKPFIGTRASVVQANEISFIFSTTETYDFIFSDADHFNTDKWFDYVFDRLLNKNGILIYHDICESNPGPGRAWFPNLANILRRVREQGMHHKLFKRQSLASERCWRGMLVIFKQER